MGLSKSFNELTSKRIAELTKRYNIKTLPEPKRDAYVEANGAIICLRWWGQKPIVSIQRTAEEKARLSVNNKFGDVIPLSSLRVFQQAVMKVIPELSQYAKADNAYDLQFNTMDNVAAFYFLLDRIDSNKEQLALSIKK